MAPQAASVVMGAVRLLSLGHCGVLLAVLASSRPRPRSISHASVSSPHKPAYSRPSSYLSSNTPTTHWPPSHSSLALPLLSIHPLTTPLASLPPSPPSHSRCHPLHPKTQRTLPHSSSSHILFHTFILSYHSYLPSSNHLTSPFSLS